MPNCSRIPPDKRLRVVFIDHCAQLSGGEIALLNLLVVLPQVDAHVVLAEDGPLVAALRAAGISVEILAMRERTRHLDRTEIKVGFAGVQHVASSVAYALRLARRLGELSPDIVHTNSLKASLYGGMAAKVVGRPVVWQVRDRISSDYLSPPAVRLVHLAANLIPDILIASSKATLDTLCLPGQRARRRAIIIHDAVPAMPAARRKGGLRFRVGMVGRIAPWKGQDIFLWALFQAFGVADDWEAVIVGAPLFGEDAYEAAIRALAKDLGLGDNVTFAGFRGDVGKELEQMQALVHASTTPEPFGQAVVEGMSAGLAVVATDAGGPAEIIEDGVNGLLYPMGDSRALADRLRILKADAALRHRLGDAAQLRAASFLPSSTAREVSRVYERLIRTDRRT